MARTPHSTYVAALGEVRMIRDQLVPGRVGPEDVGQLIQRAATVASTARAALRRAGSTVEVLAETAGAAHPSTRNGPGS